MQIKTQTKPQTRIQREKTKEIMDAALDVFSQAGYPGASVNKIAALAGMSTPSMLYYFASKEEIYKALLTQVLERWIAPLAAIGAGAEPIEEVLAYVRANFALSQAHPRECRVLANEMLVGFPHADSELFESFRQAVAAKIVLIEGWQAAGELADVDVPHLMHLIWTTTESYANFEARFAALSPQKMETLQEDAAELLVQNFRQMLTQA